MGRVDRTIGGSVINDFPSFQATVGANQRFYIVAQSPFDAETMNSFWQCVWEADVYLIIQLSNELQYVPSSSDKCLEFGQVSGLDKGIEGRKS